MWDRTVSDTRGKRRTAWARCSVGPTCWAAVGESGGAAGKKAKRAVLGRLLEWATGEGEQSRLGPSGRKRERERFPFSYFKTNFKYKPNQI